MANQQTSQMETRYDIKCDRCSWLNRTLHCTLKEAINYAYHLHDEETGRIDILTITKENHRVYVAHVPPFSR